MESDESDHRAVQERDLFRAVDGLALVGDADAVGAIALGLGMGLVLQDTRRLC